MGRKYLGMSIYWNDVGKPVRLTVRAASGQERIEYFPKGKTVSIPQYELDKEAWSSNPEQCNFHN
jgi:hypothetical protein